MLRDAISKASQPALWAVTSGEGKAATSDKLRNKRNHVHIWQQAQKFERDR